MADKPLPKDADELPEPEADERFQRLVGTLVNTPHRPHPKPKPASESRAKRSGHKTA